MYGRTSFFHLSIHLVAGNSFAMIEFIEAGLNFLPHFAEMKLTQPILVLQEPKTFSNHFAGGLIESALNFICHKLFQFRCQRYVHRICI